MGQTSAPTAERWVLRQNKNLKLFFSCRVGWTKKGRGLDHLFTIPIKVALLQEGKKLLCHLKRT